MKDAKSWLVSFIVSAGILLFNAIFIEKIYTALGDQVKAKNVFLVSSGLFVFRVIWFYANLRIRLFMEKGRR